VVAMGEADAYRYLQVLKEAESDLKGPKPETWFDRLEQERDQLQGALQWFLEHKDLQRAMESPTTLVETAGFEPATPRMKIWYTVLSSCVVL